MSKKYRFTLNKYYNDEEMKAVSPVVANFVKRHADGSGVAVLKLRDGATVIIKKDEGDVVHLVLDNDDAFVALPKELKMARAFADLFIAKMKKDLEQFDVDAIKEKVETKAEKDLFSFLKSADTDDCDDDDDCNDDCDCDDDDDTDDCDDYHKFSDDMNTLLEIFVRAMYNLRK